MPFRTAAQAAPARQWRTVTPSDTVDLNPGCRGLYINATGDVSAVDETNNAVTFLAVAAGTVLPLAAKRVRQTGTTATVVAFW